MTDKWESGDLAWLPCYITHEGAQVLSSLKLVQVDYLVGSTGRVAYRSREALDRLGAHTGKCHGSALLGLDDLRVPAHLEVK